MSDAEIPPTAEPASVRAVEPVLPRAEPAFAPEPSGQAAPLALPAAGPAAAVTAVRAHKAGRGDIRNAALTLLAEQPANGYQIIQYIAERSHGSWRPSPGAVYPALQGLEQDGLVEQVDGAGRKAYRLTDAGRDHVAEHRARLDALWDGLATAVDERAVEINTLCEHVVTAVRHVLHDADDERYDRTRRILLDTRRSLYRLLAEQDD
ncbi:PadR family transcriptional regulator [Streptomyces mexicanus]|jgi:DNA-binding PadR family transcriptional regulator|uniref:PadR family transcriptional regulator n=1 Tax=Streptomyces mexicanus TaxID=178566 RepID=UPI0031E884B6